MTVIYIYMMSDRLKIETVKIKKNQKKKKKLNP